MLVHVVVAAVALDPAVSRQPCRDLVPVRLGLDRGGLPMRKYWRIIGLRSVSFK
jgi:hypothetical protein